jgi:CRP-like cAMP-binding protein
MKIERQLDWPCRDCTVRGSSFCSTVTGPVDEGSSALESKIPQMFFNAAKNTVFQESGTQYFPGPYVLCQGWAYRFFRFPDGRRQILSVHIPGDVFSASALFNPQTTFSVQAATNVKVCQLGSDSIKKELVNNSEACEAFGILCSTEVEEAAATSVNLTEPHATARIVGFIRYLVARLTARGIQNAANVYPFPLTPTEIADATGLAPDDVTRAIRILREEYVIDLSNDEVTILDHAKFENSALMAIR